eukprot:TRINITY_DN3259_c0_g1_i1.p1 TRINITY_DN3259_c0_g1~~TRINITY_DN3259_c0_g1_i1.p1  ORF type:complete len:337 (-),score=94.76 TRINITY_DN3259_c0_g1_i1:72-995(-)
MSGPFLRKLYPLMQVCVVAVAVPVLFVFALVALFVPWVRPRSNAVKAPKSVVITGASSGIGEALVYHYARLPSVHCISIVGRNRERLNIIKEKCVEMGAGVINVGVFDVVKERKEFEEWLLDVDQQSESGIDIVIANAGVNCNTNEASLSSSEETDQYREIMDTNIIGVNNTIFPLIPRFLERKKGQFVLMSSLAAFSPSVIDPAYSASKVAILMLSRNLRALYRSDGVGFTAIAPGFVKTPLTDKNVGFPMPFLMDVNEATKIITTGIANDQSVISFPLPMSLITYFASFVPDDILDLVLGRLINA